MSRPVIISCANYKGGVGKTTLTAVLAAGLALRRDKRVLVFDADPQANLTEVFISESRLGRILWDADFRGQVFSLDFVQQSDTSYPYLAPVTNNLFIVPSHPKYMRILESITPPVRAVIETFRNNLISRLERYRFDYIFIDLPPQMYGLVSPLMKAADLLITPVTGTRFAVNALRYLLEHNLKETNEEKPVFLGSVLVRFRTVETRAIQDYKMEVDKAVDEAYKSYGVTPTLSKVGLPSFFENVLYYHSSLSKIRALLIGEPYIVKLLSGRFKGSEKVISFIDPLLDEFESRVSKLMSQVS